MELIWQQQLNRSTLRLALAEAVTTLPTVIALPNSKQHEAETSL
jgi:hypothetical protein